MSEKPEHAPSRVRVWQIVAFTYVMGRLTVQALVAGSLRLTPELGTHLLIVPVAQIAALELVRRLRRSRSW